MEERPHYKGGIGESIKKTVALRIIIVIKSKRNIYKNYSP